MVRDKNEKLYIQVKSEAGKQTASESHRMMWAHKFAEECHKVENHRRKYTDEPYIVHPVAVAEIVLGVGGTADMVSAAYLHDVIEDCKTETLFSVAKMFNFKLPINHATLCIAVFGQRLIGLRVLEHIFGEKVAAYVCQLTDVSTSSDGNRAARKEKDRQHTAKASPEAKTIKLADLIDNSLSILEHDPKFAKTYMQEKRLLLEVLQEGNAELFVRAQGLVEGYFAAESA